MNKRVLVTGAGGFVGRHFIAALEKQGFSVRLCYRDRRDSSDSISFPQSSLEWSRALEGVDFIVHLAGLAHKSRSRDHEHYLSNAMTTKNLVENLKSSNVKKLVYVSSAAVYGEESVEPFHEASIPRPHSAYGLSKLFAEFFVQNSIVPYVIVRPPLIYGKDAPGNFRKLLKLASLPIVLPLGRTQNSRSYISIDNFCDFLIFCLRSDSAHNEIFNVSDGFDLSTTEMMRQFNISGQLRAFNIAMSPTILKALFFFFGQRGLASKLLGNFCLDISHARNHLGWRPPLDVKESFKKIFDS